MSDKPLKLKKVMRPIDVWGLALGAIIGWGCFVLPGTAFLPKAGPAGTAAGMLIGALLIIVIAVSYGYLIRKWARRALPDEAQMKEDLSSDVTEATIGKSTRGSLAFQGFLLYVFAVMLLL